MSQNAGPEPPASPAYNQDDDERTVPLSRRRSGLDNRRSSKGQHQIADGVFCRGASFLGGVSAEFAEVDRSIGYCGQYVGCAYTEIPGVSVERERLEDARGEGLSFALLARSGHETPAIIPAKYIQAILKAVDAADLQDQSSSNDGSMAAATMK